MLRIAIVDDQELLRGGVAMVVDSQPDMTVVVQAANGAEAVTALAREPVDVVVMDVRMPVMDGIEATARIQRLPEPPRVLILTTFDLDESALAALRAGASGFLLKEAPGEELVAAIRQVHQGDTIVAPSTTARLLEQLVSGSTPRADPITDRLSAREIEVVRLMARGQSNSEIASTLYLSETTVKTHVRSILRKLRVRDRVQVVIAAYESGLMGFR
ncbi:MAG: response regulator transcription factor [Propionibacteriaceae bacterium]